MGHTPSQKLRRGGKEAGGGGEVEWVITNWATSAAGGRGRAVKPQGPRRLAVLGPL